MSAHQQPPQQPKHQSERSQKHLPGYEQTPRPEAEPDALKQLSNDQLDTVALRLMELDFGQDGLTRDEIRKKYRDLPEVVYLRMPSRRHFLNAEEIVRDVLDARSRAEGEYLGPDPDIPDAASVSDGGPPAWGGDPLLTEDAIEDGGSAEDTEGLDLTDAEDEGQIQGRITDRDR